MKKLKSEKLQLKVMIRFKALKNKQLLAGFCQRRFSLISFVTICNKDDGTKSSRTER